MKNSDLKKLLMLGASAGLIFGNGCANNPRARAVGDGLAYGVIENVLGHVVDNMMNPNRGGGTSNQIPENVIWDGEEYQPAPGYQWMLPDVRDDYRVISENVIWDSEEGYSPAPGYTWVDKEDNDDLRVRRKKMPEKPRTFNIKNLPEYPED